MLREDIERPFESRANVVEVLELIRLFCEGHRVDVQVMSSDDPLMTSLMTPDDPLMRGFAWTCRTTCARNSRRPRAMIW